MLSPTNSRLRTVFLCVLLMVGTLVVTARAARKPFWFDEILTLNIASLPVGLPMWQALTSGFDLNPPGLYVATHVSEKLFGRGPVTSRLPPILSGLIVFICAFHVAARSGGTVSGFWALFLLPISGLFPYFYEARSYALVLAGTMIAWLSWQRLVGHSRYRGLNLAGLAAGLTLALASHVWAIVVPPCFVVAALGRWMRTRILDVGSLVAMVAPGVIVLSYAPIAAAAGNVQFKGPVYSTNLASPYVATLGGMPLLVAACVLVLTAVTWYAPSESEAAELHPRSGPLLEDILLAVCLVLAAIPLYVISKILGSPFVPRYVLVAGLGETFLFAQMLGVLSRRAPIGSYVVPFLIGAGLSGYAIRSEVLKPGWKIGNVIEPDLRQLVRVADSQEPIVYSQGVDFLQADFYAPPELAKRQVYIADRRLAIQFLGTDGIDSAFVLAGNRLAIRGLVVSFSDFKRLHRSFWLLGDSKRVFNWISEKLRADGADIRVLNLRNTRICHVTFVEP